MSHDFLSLTQCVQLIAAVGDKRTVFVEGPMGIGKSAMYHALKKIPALANHHFPGLIDCTQLGDGSLAMPGLDNVRGISRELPNERFGVNEENHAGVAGSKPVVLCFDEIGKAKQFVKDMCAPLIYERRLGNLRFPEGSIVFGTTNMAYEGLGDSLQPHLRNRVTMVKCMPPTQQEWVDNFALHNNIAPELIAATFEYPRIFDSFIDYMPGGKHSGETLEKHNPYIHNPRNNTGKACVTTRSLHAASDLIHRKHLMDDHTLQVALEGTVGAAFAKDLGAFIRFGRNLPPYASVIADPLKAKVPESPLAQAVQAFQFVTQCADAKEAEAIAIYTPRMQKEIQMLLVTNAAKSNLTKFAASKSFGKLLMENKQFLSLV